MPNRVLAQLRLSTLYRHKTENIKKFIKGQIFDTCGNQRLKPPTRHMYVLRQIIFNYP